jgi:hypothetical protein
MSASRRQCVWPALAASAYILQRSGKRPIRFVGSTLACSDGAAHPAWARLRLALYARNDGGYVSEILCLPACVQPPCGAAPAAWRFAAPAENLAAALAHFEAVAALPDELAPLDAPLDAPGDARAALFEAAGRLCRITAQNRALRHTVGEFLYRLCMDMLNAR